MVRELLALGSLALLAVGCDETDCAGGCSGTGFIRAYTANGELLDADEVLVELHEDGIVCSVAIEGTDATSPREPCEANISVRRGTAVSCSSADDGCVRDPATSIAVFLDPPDGPVTITLLRDGETIAKKKFGLQPPLSSGPDCGSCPHFEHDWRLDG